MAEFIKGKTPVPASGKVVGTAEKINAIKAVLEGWFTEGHWTDEFEALMAKYLGTRYGSMCNSGSSANLLAISALTSPLLKDRRLRPGDEVITAAAGFPTTIAPIVQNRLVPVFVDVDLDTLVPSAEMIEEAIGPKTKAIMLAHTLGNPWPVDQFANKDLWIIEDNCDALGSVLKGKRTGSIGDLATQSFYPAHHITTGEGGMVMCNEPILKKAVESFRDWGRDCWCEPGKDNTCGKRFDHKFPYLPEGYDHKYVYSHMGYNLKSTDLQAAIGVAQMRRLDEFAAIRHRNWNYLDDYFRNSMSSHMIVPSDWTSGSRPSWFGYPLTLTRDAPFTVRDLEIYLAERKVGTRRLFAGNFLRQPAFVDAIQIKNLGMKWRIAGDLPSAEAIAARTLWVGCWHGLTEDQIFWIVESVLEFCERF